GEQRSQGSAGRDPKDGSDISGRPIEVTVISHSQSIFLGRRAIGSVKGGDDSHRSVRRNAEHRAGKVFSCFGRRSVKIAGRVHDKLALWKGAIRSAERGKGGDRPVGREAKHGARIKMCATRDGCAVKIAVLAQSQPTLWSRAVRSVEREQ